MYQRLFFVSLLTLSLAGEVVAQDREIKIQAIDGKNGKPIPHQRLVIFGGESAEAPRFHRTAFELTTDDAGIAEMKFSLGNTSWIQVWADGMTLCQSKPNLNSFSVDTILTAGLSTPNSCGSLRKNLTPGTFTVYARPSSLREKMER